MSHRKVYSQGSIPFSWEDSPGVSKVNIHQQLPMNHDHLGLNNATNISSPIPLPNLFPRDSDYSPKDLAHDHHYMRKIPLPPCQKVEAPPPRSASVKGFRWWQEDPFLAAYKECTKNVRNNGKLSNESKKSSSVGSKVRKSRLIFSCKNTCDVQEDSLVRLATLPPIPRDRVRAR